MVWMPSSTGKRGRQPQYSDAAIQTFLTMKVLFGMALRQTTGFVESLLRLVGLDWAVPDFSTLSRRQKTLAVTIPYRGSEGPLNLLIDNEALTAIGPGTMLNGSKAEGEGEWHARTHSGAKRRLWRKIHIAVDEQALEIQAIEIVGDAPMLPELLDQIPADVEIGSVSADGATTRVSAMTPSQAGVPMPSSRRVRTPNRGRHRPERGPARVEIPRPRHLASLDRLSPPKPRRDEDALREAAGAKPQGARVRSSGRRTPDPRCRSERLHRARHTHHRTRRISASGERGGPGFIRFANQSSYVTNTSSSDSPSPSIRRKAAVISPRRLERQNRPGAPERGCRSRYRRSPFSPGQQAGRAWRPIERFVRRRSRRKNTSTEIGGAGPARRQHRCLFRMCYHACHHNPNSPMAARDICPGRRRRNHSGVSPRSAETGSRKARLA